MIHAMSTSLAHTSNRIKEVIWTPGGEYTGINLLVWAYKC
jgi:hypothetical protein